MKKLALADVLQNAVDIIFDDIKNICVLILVSILVMASILGTGVLVTVAAPLGKMSLSIMFIVGIATFLIAGFIYLTLVHQLVMAARKNVAPLKESMKEAQKHYLKYIGVVLIVGFVSVALSMIFMMIFMFIPLGVLAIIPSLLVSALVSYILFLTIAILVFDNKGTIESLKLNHQWMMAHVKPEVFLVAFVVVSIPVLFKTLLGDNFLFMIADLLFFLIYQALAAATYTKVKARMAGGEGAVEAQQEPESGDVSESAESKEDEA